MMERSFYIKLVIGVVLGSFGNISFIVSVFKLVHVEILSISFIRLSCVILRGFELYYCLLIWRVILIDWLVVLLIFILLLVIIFLLVVI